MRTDHLRRLGGGVIHYLRCDSASYRRLLVTIAAMSVKLVYFPVRGRGQAIRYLCLDKDVKLEEDVVSMGDWPKVKPTTPFGQLPVLKDGNFDIPQSNAILRHLARKYGLYGKDEVEATKVDMLNDQQEDLRMAYLNMIYRNYELGKDEFISKLPGQLKVFEDVLSKNHGGKGYFVGDGITFVDYNIFDLLDNLLTLCPSCLDSFPMLKDFYKRIGARQKIAAHRQSETFKKLPINGNGKQ